MNTNRLKRFAQEARVKLLDQVNSRLELVLSTDSAELREKAASVQQLKEAIKSSSREQVVDKVAYTWFNRLMALRFMDVNDYQPLNLKVITPKEGFTLPEILEDTNKGQIPEELPVNKQKINDLLDGKIPSNNVQNEIYKELLIGACNHLHSVFPFLFEKINDYTELLLPNDLTSEFSIVNDFVEGMQKEDCEEVEVIGWLYQFYISEKKDEVFASKGKVKKEEIPSATQLFTPRWIVEYMVQNTVGKLWLQNKPNSSLREHMPYFIESPSVTAEDYLKVDSVEEITLLDQACGSGHILVYGFELLSKIYEEEGYTPSEIPQLIIEKNLYGFEIDERAAQLASFALMMKSRAYHRRVFRKEIVTNIMCFEDVVFSQQELMQVLVKTSLDKCRELQNDLKLLENATNFGSLIQPETSSNYLQKALQEISKKLKGADVFEQHLLEKLKIAVNQLLPLSKKYHCVVDNPPYMGDSNYNKELSLFINKNYPKSRLDLMTCFMEAGINGLLEKGLLGMINQHSWMFISSYKSLRKHLLATVSFNNMLHLGPRTFPEIGGEVVQSTSFIISNYNKISTASKFLRLVDYGSTELKQKAALEALKGDLASVVFEKKQNAFKLIPNNNFCYWFSEKVIDNFKGNKIDDVSTTKAGIVSGNDSDFLRLWFECNFKNISFNEETFVKNSSVMWAPINKGGSIRKYFGNEEYVINLYNLYLEGRTNKSVRRGDPSFYFKEGITWTYVCGTSFSFRLSKNSTFATAAPAIFLNSTIYTLYCLALLNSKVITSLLPGVNPTMNLGSGDISRLPYIDPANQKTREAITTLVEKNISISRREWDSRENSWGFTQSELVKTRTQSLKDSYKQYRETWKSFFLVLRKNEEELNHEFIQIYDLQKDLTPEVTLEEITLLKEEVKIKNSELIFNRKEIFAQFMSYAVGCMFGRYSLDNEGLILANQGETLQDYLHKLQRSNSKFQSLEDLTFVPDEDNIIPVLDDEWFEDDIVGRFYEFLKASFGKENFDKNLAFVEECLGKDVRKYFVRDFYKGHIKRYKKRPIYWMFSSPKGSFNVLIYLHRYTPDTLNNILNGYLLEYKEKIKARMEHLDHIIETGSSTEQTKAGKEKDKLKKVLLELQDYEREILYPLATERISIDLDEGVLVNYNKFGQAIQEVSGLNDKKAKKKVRGFDWIDTKQII